MTHPVKLVRIVIPDTGGKAGVPDRLTGDAHKCDARGTRPPSFGLRPSFQSSGRATMLKRGKT